ncbi:MAG: hypothetical protein IT237_02430 [Bacteroidia bacterium]|nr:hypothetical protein [Bacteroidia bacterium]
MNNFDDYVKDNKESLPFAFSFYKCNGSEKTFQPPLFDIVTVDRYNTDNYIVYGFYRPISKIILPHEVL